MASRAAILFFVAAYTSCITAVYSQGYSGQPPALLGSRNDLLRSYDLNRLSIRTKGNNRKGPVLFPNDAPAPPRPPLIVTSRPLIEQIARSELNPSPQASNASSSEQSQIDKNTIAEQSQISGVQLNQPRFLARVKQYSPISFQTPSPPTSVILVDAVTGRPLYSGSFREHQASSGSVDYTPEYRSPYTDFVNRNQDVNSRGDREYRIDDNGEVQSTLPPIYKAFSDHAQKALKINQEKKMSDVYNGIGVKQTNTADQNYLNKLQNEGRITTSGEYIQGKNYAFSYSVKDQKSGDDFSHRQRSSGAATNGEYRVRLPDGRMQIVSYVADENGYQADVRYDEETVKTSGNTIEADKASEEYYPDQSKNYYNEDYSDYMNGDDVQRKFASFDAQATPRPIVVAPQNSYKSSTVTPSYDVLKALFVTKNPHNFYRKTPFQFNVPSTTENPFVYDHSTERVVVIGTPKSRLYTNIRSATPNYSTNSYPSSTVNPVFTRNVNMANNKAILSDSYIDRINKYLSFK